MAHEAGSIAKELFVEAFSKPLYTDGAADFTPVDPIHYSQGARSVEVTVLASTAAPIVAEGTKTEPSEGTSTKETIALNITVPLNELIAGVSPDLVANPDTMSATQLINLTKKVQNGANRIKQTVDKARLTKLAANATTMTYAEDPDGAGAGEAGDPDYTVITGDNVYKYITSATELSDSVAGSMRTLFISSATKKAIKLGKVLLDTDAGAEMVSSGEIGYLDGARVVAVPGTNMPAEIDFMLVTYECAAYAGVPMEDIDVKVIDASLLFPGSSSINGKFIGGAATTVPAGVIVKLNKAFT